MPYFDQASFAVRCDREHLAASSSGGELAEPGFARRRAARLLLLDEEARVLLFQYRDRRGTWWATPGGGLEASETFETAAVREAREELGLSEFTLERLWEQTTEFESRGELIHQQERYFLVRQAGDIALGEDVRDAHALEGILAARWWSRRDIAVATEPIFPEDLAQRLEDLRRACDDRRP